MTVSETREFLFKQSRMPPKGSKRSTAVAPSQKLLKFERAASSEHPPAMAGLADVALPFDALAKFDEAAIDGSLNAMITEALKYAQTLSTTAVGAACNVYTYEQIKERAESAQGSIRMTLFGGTLSMLDMTQEATPQTPDLGRTRAALGALKTAKDITGMVGTIIINFEMWRDPKHGLARGALVRANKDAEVQAAALVRLWCKDAGENIKEVVDDALRDIAYDGRCLGTGTKFEMEKLRMIEKEEAQRLEGTRNL